MVIGRPLKSSPQPPCNACRHTGDIDATCCEDAVSGVSRAEPDILWNFRRPQICLFCMRISDVIRPSVCNPRYSGEYIINYISLLIISILPSIWSYILKECQVLVEETEAETQSWASYLCASWVCRCGCGLNLEPIVLSSPPCGIRIQRKFSP